MTKITVHSKICGYTHEVSGEFSGGKVIVDIDTPCEKIQKFSHMEIPKKELFGIRDNHVIKKAEEADCSATCIVPAAVLHACWLEAGFMAKSAAVSAEKICMEFDEVGVEK